jgi:hypothetical protein
MFPHPGHLARGLALAAGLLAPVLAAALPGPEDPEWEGTRRGVVTRDQVNLRAGPSTAYEVVAKLPKELGLRISGSAFGWYRVHPQTEVPLYVSAELVELKEGGVGVIRKDRVNLRARAQLSGTVVGQAHAGDPVRVLEAGEVWVKIVAPEDAVFYLHGDLVELREGAVPAEPTGAGGEQEPTAEPEVAGPEVLMTRAAQLFNRELSKPHIQAMSFVEARRLFEEARAAAETPELQAAAERGIKRIEAFERLQRDYERRKRAIDDALGAEADGGARSSGS